MPINLKVSTGELRRVAKQFTDSATTLTTQLTQLQSHVAGLDPRWQDDASRRFKGAMPAHEAKIKKAIETFTKSAANLNLIAQVYDDMERTAASKIR